MAWLGPDEKNLDWMVPLATVVLLVGFFFASYWIEASLMVYLLRTQDPLAVRSAVWDANLLSYFFLELLAIGALSYALISRYTRA